MFAIAIWDARRRRLLLARDRFGIKPLYYRSIDGELAFASELRALPRGEIDPDALEAFLAFNSIPAPLTIFREVRKLPPGHLLIWENGRVDVQRFARPVPIEELREDEEAELVEELRSRRGTPCAHTRQRARRRLLQAASTPRSSPLWPPRRAPSRCARSQLDSRSAL
jgi:asparagine synthase (glutamine-hydrolysing)